MALYMTLQYKVSLTENTVITDIKRRVIVAMHIPCRLVHGVSLYILYIHRILYIE
jgi:hypothetical protein